MILSKGLSGKPDKRRQDIEALSEMAALTVGSSLLLYRSHAGIRLSQTTITLTSDTRKLLLPCVTLLCFFFHRLFRTPIPTCWSCPTRFIVKGEFSECEAGKWCGIYIICFFAITWSFVVRPTCGRTYCSDCLSVITCTLATRSIRSLR